MLNGVETSVITDPAGRPLLRKTAKSPEARTRVRREAEILARFTHPGIVELVDLAESDDETVMTQRWAGSQTLASVGRLPVNEAAGVVAALSSTVADLHDAGLAHHRLNPSHVVLSPEGRPVLCGLAEAINDPAAQTADVGGLGQILRELLGNESEFEPIPERNRFGFRRAKWSGYRRRALLNLGDQATADYADQRPSARQFAASVASTVPEACLAHPAPPAAAGSATDQLRGVAPAEPAPAEPSPAKPDVPVEPSPALAATDARDGETSWDEFWHAGASSSPDGAFDTAPEPVPVPPAHPAPTSPLGSTGRGVEPSTGLGGLRNIGSGALPSRRRVRAVAALGAVALVAAGWFALRNSDGAKHASRLQPDATTVVAHNDDAAGAQRASANSTCAPSLGPAADIDGQGCPQPITVEGRVVSVGDTRFEVGMPGDQVVVGDWRCDNQATPALLRPTTGEIFVFPKWTAADADVTVPASTVVEGADGLRGERRGTCDALLATRPGQPPVEVPMAPA